MSNIHWKVTIEKNRRSQNFNFLSLKKFSPSQFLGRSSSRRYHWILKRLVATSKSVVWKKKYVWLFHYFNFERNHDALKPKSACILLNKNINFNENEMESKLENSTHVFREKNLLLQLISESKIQSKTGMSWSSPKKKDDIFCAVYLVQGKFFNICI